MDYQNDQDFELDFTDCTDFESWDVLEDEREVVDEFMTFDY